jgi:hypothetical protein
MANICRPGITTVKISSTDLLTVWEHGWLDCADYFREAFDEKRESGIQDFNAWRDELLRVLVNGYGMSWISNDDDTN